jgi:hypothetical protein
VCLPLQVFPENGPTNKMMDYEFLRIFLNSKEVKINYGGIKSDRSKDNHKKNLSEIEQVNSAIKNNAKYVLANKNGLSPKSFELLHALKIIYEDKEYILYAKY